MSDVAPANFRAKFDRGHEDADLAVDFMEQEVGRLDWRTNWPKFKERYPTREALQDRVREWLDRMEIDHEPDGVVRYLDGMLERMTGKWR